MRTDFSPSSSCRNWITGFHRREMGATPPENSPKISRFLPWRRVPNRRILSLPEAIPFPDRIAPNVGSSNASSPSVRFSNQSDGPRGRHRMEEAPFSDAISQPFRRLPLLQNRGSESNFDHQKGIVEEPDNERDVEAQHPPQSHRFKYDPPGWGQRLLVSTRLKNKLESSKIIRVPYARSHKYTLVLTLLFTGAFLTPQLLPKWIGFEWASPEDLCQSPDDKLNEIHRQVLNMTLIRDAKHFIEQQEYTLDCMNRSAADFYHGKNGKPPRFLWPKECDSEKARMALNETTCVEQKTNICKRVNFFARLFVSVSGNCVQKTGPDLCVESTNAERSESLYQLEKERNAFEQNFTDIKTEPIVATAESKISQIINRLMLQVDLAADCFIVYSVVSVLVGIPLVISKREKTSRVVGATLGLTKMTFVMVFIILLSLYDSAFLIFRDTDFPRMFQNFLNDPCYVNPDFSARRVGMIVDVCNNISYIDQQSDYILQRMDRVYYDTRLFGHCKDDDRELAVHPKLKAMDKIRKMYREGNISNPGICNATELDTRTSVAPENERTSKWKALMGSGVVAQLLLKIVFTGWIIHFLSFIEPMVLHSGKVELWGVKSRTSLSEEDEKAIRRFARDKHLLPLIFFSTLLAIEIALFGYSIYTTISGAGEIQTHNNKTMPLTKPPELRCPSVLGL